MGKAKIAITLDERIVGRLDLLVKQEAYTNRSQAIEAAIRDKLQRLDRTRLAQELNKLDPDYEKALAEEGIATDGAAWPEF
jgi:metal-responsive CopG/Arc/MetJ family transcriptional regulator